MTKAIEKVRSEMNHVEREYKRASKNANQAKSKETRLKWLAVCREMKARFDVLHGRVGEMETKRDARPPKKQSRAGAKRGPKRTAKRRTSAQQRKAAPRETETAGQATYWLYILDRPGTRGEVVGWTVSKKRAREWVAAGPAGECWAFDRANREKNGTGERHGWEAGVAA